MMQTNLQRLAMADKDTRKTGPCVAEERAWIGRVLRHPKTDYCLLSRRLALVDPLSHTYRLTFGGIVAVTAARRSADICAVLGQDRYSVRHCGDLEQHQLVSSQQETICVAFEQLYVFR